MEPCMIVPAMRNPVYCVRSEGYKFCKGDRTERPRPAHGPVVGAGPIAFNVKLRVASLDAAPLLPQPAE